MLSCLIYSPDYGGYIQKDYQQRIQRIRLIKAATKHMGHNITHTEQPYPPVAMMVTDELERVPYSHQDNGHKQASTENP